LTPIPKDRIEIPFKEDMEEAILQGKKTCTSRTRRYGCIGKCFQIRGKWFELTQIMQVRFCFILNALYKEEGFDSSIQFAHRWGQIHPREKWDTGRILWVHHFKPLQEPPI